MVFWNLSVWALNGAENWIVPKDCWERRKKCRLGHLLACHGEVLYWQIIETALTHHSPSWRWVLWTMVWIRCQLRPISSEKLARNAIREVALWKFKFSTFRLHLYGREAFGRLLPKLIMYACSLPGLFIRALMRNKKTKSSLKFRPDPSLMFYLEGRGRVWVKKGGVTNGTEAWCLHLRLHVSQEQLISNRQSWMRLFMFYPLRNGCPLLGNSKAVVIEI